MITSFYTAKKINNGSMLLMCTHCAFNAVRWCSIDGRRLDPEQYVIFTGKHLHYNKALTLCIKLAMHAWRIDNMQHFKKNPDWEFFTSKIQSSMCGDVNCLYCLCSDVNLPVSPAGHYIVGTDALGRSLSLQYLPIFLVTHSVHFSPFCSNRVVFPMLSVLLSSAV